MKTISEILSSSVAFLQQKGVAKPRLTAETLIAAALGLKRMDLYLLFERPLQEAELAPIRTYLKRAALHEPVEYIIPSIAFGKAELALSCDVLIPRQETEILVDLICKQVEDREGQVLLDLCTGSGCIGIALKLALPKTDVVMIDSSASALAMARQNAEKNGVVIEGVQSDLLQNFEGRKVDIVVCNPPYVSLSEYAQLEESVRLFEPKQALVGGEDGLLYYRRLQEELPPHLNRKAKIFFEIGASQGQAVEQLFSAPCWKLQRIEKDWAGLDRFFFLEFE